MRNRTMLCRQGVLIALAIAAWPADPGLLNSPVWSAPPPRKTPAKRSTSKDSPAAPNWLPFPGQVADFEKWFEPLFGKPTPEEEQQLARVVVSRRAEVDFGQEMVSAYLASLKQEGIHWTDRGRDVDYLRQLVETLRPWMVHADRYPQIRVYVVDSTRIDARSFPGGSLFFYAGLLDFAETEAALIGIVGHELSHLDRQHQLLPLKRNRMFAALRTDGNRVPLDPQQLLANGALVGRLMSRPFRPEDESAADRDGAEWSYRAGYDPRELARLFARMHERSRDPKLPFASLFRTHPYHDDRDQAIQNQYRELQREQPLADPYRGRKNLSRRIPKAEQMFPE